MTKKQTKQEITAENNGHVKFNVYNGKGKSKELKTLEELKEDFKKAFEQNGVLYQEDVLDALDPLECTFGLDFKFFNTYGPSNMYHITDLEGNISDLIDNV